MGILTTRIRMSTPDRPMKVLFLSIVPSPYQRDIFASLNKLDDLEIAVRYAEAGSPDSPWPKEALAAYEKVYPSFYLSWQGKRFIVNRQLPSVADFDAVVLNGYVTIPAQWILRTAGKKVPLIFWGEKLEAAQGGVREFAQRRLTRPLRNLRAIVAIGKKATRDYKRRYPAIPVYEVPYYCEVKAFQGKRAERPRTPVNILFCGQMIARKGIDLLLEAFTGLIANGPSAHLTLVGREADIGDRLERLPSSVRQHITNAGFKAPRELPEVFAEADVFVLPSRYDGWGVVVNQALGAGLPVVCSDAVGAAEDLVVPGRNGYVFTSGNTAELREALEALVTSPERIRSYGRESLRMSAQITPEQGARDWLRILKEILGR